MTDPTWELAHSRDQVNVRCGASELYNYGFPGRKRLMCGPREGVLCVQSDDPGLGSFLLFTAGWT